MTGLHENDRQKQFIGCSQEILQNSDSLDAIDRQMDSEEVDYAAGLACEVSEEHFDFSMESHLNLHEEENYKAFTVTVCL